MDSHELMRLLVPDTKVKSVAEFTGLTTSLLYMERREAGKDLTSTGTRNTIDRLDLFCEWNLSRSPDLVRIVGERYTRMYRNHISPVEDITIHDLIRQLGEASRECGEAISRIAGMGSINECTVDVGQAKAALEKALAYMTAMEEQNT